MLLYGKDIPVRCGIMISGERARDPITGNINIGFFLFEPFAVDTLDDVTKKKLFKLESSFLEKYFGGGQELVIWLSKLAKGQNLDAETIEMLQANFEAKLSEIRKENKVLSTEDLIKSIL